MKRPALAILVAILLAILASSFLAAQSRARPTTAIQGAWRIVEVVSAGQAAPTPMPQPSLYLFTGKHFSFVAVSSTTPRPNLQDPSNVTGPDALAVWGPFMAQTGTYEVSGTTLSVKPLVAKNPGAMAGNVTTYAYELDGDVLTLTVQQNGAGTMAPVTRLTRVE